MRGCRTESRQLLISWLVDLLRRVACCVAALLWLPLWLPHAVAAAAPLLPCCLQSNKVKALLEAVPNLALLETVDSAKLASKLDSTGMQTRG